MPSSAVNVNGSNARNHTMKELPDEAIDAIVRRDIREGQSFTLHVTGNSMAPDLSPGDKIVVSPGRCFPGDVIAFLTHEPGKRKIHRYLGLLWTPGGWKKLAKGDNTKTPDELIRPVDLVGKVKFLNGEKFRPGFRVRLRATGSYLNWSIRILAGKLLP